MEQPPRGRGPRPTSSYAPFAASYFPPPPVGAGGGDDFWEKYKYWIIGAAVVSASIAIYFYIKSKQDEAEDERKRERLEDRVKAEQYAEKRAQQLAHAYLQDNLEKRGIRHDIGDPGIQSDLGATHDWEANTEQKASPQGVAVTSEITQIATPAVPDDDASDDVELSDDDLIY